MSITRPITTVADQVYYTQTGILYSDFTDGGAAVGTLTCGFELPVGFLIEKTILKNVTGFTGNTSATITIGDGSDADRLNTGTPSVFTTVATIDGGAVSGTALVATAFKPVLTVTGDSNFTAITAGQLDIRVYGKQL